MDKVTKMLNRVSIDPNQPIFVISAEEAVRNLMEAIEEFCPNLAIDQMAQEELATLIQSYGNSVTLYHPEQYHQERAALLENFSLLKQYGLTDQDCRSLEFS